MPVAPTLMLTHMTPAPSSALSLIGYRYEVSAGEYIYVTAEDAPFTSSVEDSLVEGLHLTPQPGCSNLVEVYLCGRCWMPVEGVGRMILTGWTALYLGPKV